MAIHYDPVFSEYDVIDRITEDILTWRKLFLDVNIMKELPCTK